MWLKGGFRLRGAFAAVRCAAVLVLQARYEVPLSPAPEPHLGWEWSSTSHVLSSHVPRDGAGLRYVPESTSVCPFGNSFINLRTPVRRILRLSSNC